MCLILVTIRDASTDFTCSMSVTTRDASTDFTCSILATTAMRARTSRAWYQSTAAACNSELGQTLKLFLQPESRVSYRSKFGLALLFLQNPACLTDQSLDWRCFTARVPHIVTDQSLNRRCFTDRVPLIARDQNLDSGVLLLLLFYRQSPADCYKPKFGLASRVPRIVTDQS